MIVVYGKILNPIRPDWEVFKCTLCSGFWVGLFWWFLLPPEQLDNVAGCFASGFLSAGTSYFISKIVNDDGFKISK